MATDFRAGDTSATGEPRELPVADLIGRGLIERHYGAPYDPLGIHVNEGAAAVEGEMVIDLRDSSLLRDGGAVSDVHAHLSPRELRARWRAFRTYWLGHMCSMIGDHFTMVALPLAADRLTGSGLLVGLIVSAEVIATVLFGTAAGTYTDRRDPRPVMIASDLLRAGVLAVLAFLTWQDVEPAIVLVIAAFALGVLRLMHDGAESTLVARLVPDELDVRSNARLTLSENIGLTVGTLAAGAITTIGIWIAFGIDSLTFVIAAIALALVGRSARRRHLLDPLPDEPVTQPRFRTEFATAFRSIRAHRVYFHSLILLAFINIAALPLGSQLVTLAKQQLHLSDFAIGALFALGGLSGILAAPLVERGTSIRLSSVLGGGALLSAGVLVVGIVPSVATVALAMVLAGLGLAAAMTHHSALRQRVFASNMQGRVALTSRMLLWSTIPFAALAGGWLSDHVDPAAMWLACGATGLAAVAWALLMGLGRVRLD